MYTSLPSFHDVRRPKLRKPFEPEACCLRLAVPELPWLDDLIRLPDLRRDHGYRVLDCNPGDRRGHKKTDKIERPLLPTVRDLLCEVPRAAHGKVSAWRVRDHHVPAHAKKVADIAPDVEVAVVVAWQKIAGERVEAAFTKRLPDDAGKFAGDKNAQLAHDIPQNRNPMNPKATAAATSALAFMLLPSLSERREADGIRLDGWRREDGSALANTQPRRTCVRSCL